MENKHIVPNSRSNASCISKLLFWWIFPLLKKGAKKDLQIEDLNGVLPEDESSRLGEKLSECWAKERANADKDQRRPRFYRALLGQHYTQFVLYGCLAFVNECVIRVAQTVFFQQLIATFKQESSLQEQLLYGTGVVGSAVIYSLIVHPITFGHQHVGMKCRVASCSLIYRKALKLSKSVQGQTTVGQMINLMSNDVSRFDTNLYILHYIYIAPIQMGIFMYFLWTLGDLGITCLVGAGFVVILIPLQGYTSKILSDFRAEAATRTDSRSQNMNETISAIRVIKMYAWEKPFTILVDKIRRAEIKILRKIAFLRAFYLSLYVSSSKLITYLTLLVFLLSGGPLKAETVFFMISVYNIILQTMVQYFPSALATLGEVMVSLDRIEAFLLHEEKETTKYLQITNTWNKKPALSTLSRNEGSVTMNNLNANWTANNLTLENFNVYLKGDKLVMIIGPVGSGKSSFLHTIIGELPVNHGYFKLTGKSAYNSQEPWLFPGNIKENILFGQSYDPEKYSDVLHASALEEDLKQMPFGENTLVGERGISLSGGQKARINLARTLYQDAGVYLLDDPLSAVDAQVSRHIFENCMLKFLKGKLRILVTHQLQYLPKADHVIVLQAGQIVDQGKHVDLVARGIDFVSLISTEMDEEKRRQSIEVAKFINNAKLSTVSVIDDEPAHDKPTVKSEYMEVGSMALSTYWKYLRSGNSICGLLFLGFGFVFTQIIFSATEYWLSYWISESAKSDPQCSTIEFRNAGRKNDVLVALNVDTANASIYIYETISDATAVTSSCNNNSVDGNFYFYIYSALVALVIILSKTRAILFFSSCLRISVFLHNQMATSIIRAPSQFFDENPSGRILNRFTKDIGAIDELLPPILFDTFTMVLIVLGIVIVVIISNYFIILQCALLLVAIFLIRRFYIKTVQKVKRIESVARSPMFTHLAATVQGLTTIRSSGNENFLIRQFDEFQDLHSASWFAYIAINRWIALWIELTALLFLVAVTYGFILLAELGESDSSKMGLAISSAIGFSGAFQWVTRRLTETENMMTSVERVLEYTKLQSEAPLENISDHDLPPNWPERGEIKFKGVHLTYGTKPVLQNITFDIKAKEKIGIVGRTGAGKSSIVSCLFRIVEPEGEICIDNVCISTIGLNQLRKNISIIPQDPVLFTGSIRYNLDPFGQFNDDDLWKVIKEVKLQETVTHLEFEVADGGCNFSQGQRQLVCLARAILRQNKIIVIDEATANVDPLTDNFIQATIKSMFLECTIITIAHRFHSVIECDRILVLDQGKVKEYDHPYVLLQNSESALTAMVSHTGMANSNNLRKISQAAYNLSRLDPNNNN